MKNLEKFKKDLDNSIKLGDELMLALRYSCFPGDFKEQVEKAFDGDVKAAEKRIKKLPNFNNKYQDWYSESLALIKQLLPDRMEDFINLYKKPKTQRKDISNENYVIIDALQGLSVSRGSGIYREIIVDISAAIPKFNQQLNIVKSVSKRFDSSLFDIQQLLQADLFDSEIEVAEELNKKGFFRAAGAVAGVVLESHLKEVIKNHNLSFSKKNPGINDLAEFLKKEQVIDTQERRKIQHLADLRNLCDHKKKIDPTKDDIEELIKGVKKVIKNLF